MQSESDSLESTGTDRTHRTRQRKRCHLSYVGKRKAPMKDYYVPTTLTIKNRLLNEFNLQTTYLIHHPNLLFANAQLNSHHSLHPYLPPFQIEPSEQHFVIFPLDPLELFHSTPYP